LRDSGRVDAGIRIYVQILLMDKIFFCDDVDAKKIRLAAIQPAVNRSGITCDKTEPASLKKA